MSDKIELIKAEQQFCGWVSAKRGDTLIQLVRNMGLTYAEWVNLVRTRSVFYLTDEESSEISEYFRDNGNKND